MAAATIKKDDLKQQWEESEFPLVCETCLGDNPYIRMTKEPHGKACQICETPFTVFSWQAGTKGRLKRVEICQNCAKTKNVCQVCIFDLQFGLPVQLRDRILRENGGASSGGVVVPQSDANRAYFAQAQARAIEQGTAGAMAGSVEATLKLQEAARMQPRYQRNLAKLCSFFARGECNRGSRCPFRHEMPRDRNDPLAKQNTKDRFYGQHDPVARKMEGRIRAREDKVKEEDGDETSTTLYITLRRRDGIEHQHVEITEANIRNSFYSFGEIVSVRMHKNEGAFLEYTAREATSLAIAAMNRKEICGVPVYVNWARSAKRGSSEVERRGAGPAVRPNAGPDGTLAEKLAVEHETGTCKPVVPLLPPGGLKKDLAVPAGFVPMKAPISTSAGAPRPGGAVGVPRPGGGVIRRAGRSSAAPRPYYASQDPNMYGSRTPGVPQPPQS